MNAKVHFNSIAKSSRVNLRLNIGSRFARIHFGHNPKVDRNHPLLPQAKMPILYAPVMLEQVSMHESSLSHLKHREFDTFNTPQILLSIREDLHVRHDERRAAEYNYRLRRNTPY